MFGLALIAAHKPFYAIHHQLRCVGLAIQTSRVFALTLTEERR
jgi:hypothetical protein